MRFCKVGYISLLLKQITTSVRLFWDIFGKPYISFQSPYQVLAYLMIHIKFTVALGFPTQLTRKHVADMFFHAELEVEARKASTDRIIAWRFKRDSDQEQFIEEVIENAQSSLYLHHQSKDCTKKGIAAV